MSSPSSVILILLSFVLFCCGTAAGDVVSDFDDGTLQGWTAAGNGSGGITVITSGGNPGGYIKIDDINTSDYCLMVAPAVFYGDWRGKAGVSVDLIRFSGNELLSNVQIRLSGSGGSYYFGSGRIPTLVWGSFYAPLIESMWIRESGSWNGMLSNVTSFQILTDYMTGDESNGMDNVRLLDSGVKAGIGAAKQMPDGAHVKVNGIVSRVAAAYFYLQTSDRSAGLRAEGSPELDEGDYITLTGTLATMCGERVLRNILIESSIPGEPPEPVFISCRSLGGVGLSENDPALGSCRGPKQTGLFIKSAGKVTSVDDTGTFRLDDGWNTLSRCDHAAAMPVSGSFVTISGVSSSLGDPPKPCLLSTKDDFRYYKLPLGVNLIRNPGAEEGTSRKSGAPVKAIGGWKTSGSFTVTDYGYIYGENERQAINGGRSFFFGGLNCVYSEAWQDIDVSSLSEVIDSRVTARFSGYLGGIVLESDKATATASFLDGSGNQIGILQIGPQSGSTLWAYKEASAVVPKGTKTIRIKLIGQRINGKNCDAFFDKLSLVLEQ